MNADDFAFDVVILQDVLQQFGILAQSVFVELFFDLWRRLLQQFQRWQFPFTWLFQIQTRLFMFFVFTFASIFIFAGANDFDAAIIAAWRMQSACIFIVVLGFVVFVIRLFFV